MRFMGLLFVVAVGCFPTVEALRTVSTTKEDPIIGAWAAASAAAKEAAALANIPVPDEFFDPFMEFFMEDPVSASTSRISWTGK